MSIYLPWRYPNMAAPRWHGIVEDFVKGEQNSGVHEIAKELLDGKLQLLPLVEGLGPHLTNEDRHARCRGTQLLSEVLYRLPTHFLEDKEVGVLVDFYCNRLQDHHAVIPYVLQGLAALSTLPNLANGDVVLIVQSIFKTLHVQTLVQTDRRHVYSMFAHFLNNRQEALLPLGPELVYGYIQVMDSEKDPRSLIIAFQSVRVIATVFPIDRFAEELFEVVACYFPIDFTPPPNEVYSISRESLILGLRGCLSASAKFAPFCLPMLLEKFTSSVASAKLDALQTLAACAEVYGAESLQEYVISFWSEIRREVFSPQDEEIEEASLTALTAMTLAFSNHISETGKQSYLSGFLDDILKDLQHHLADPELRLIVPCSKLLQAIGWESDLARGKVIGKIVPVLLQGFHQHPQANQRRRVLDVLVKVIKLASRSNEATNPLLEHKDRIFVLLISMLMETSPDLQEVGLHGIHQMINITNLLSDRERHLVAEHCTRILLKDSNKEVREGAMAVATTMVTTDTEVIKDKMVTALIQSATEEWMETNSGDGRTMNSPCSDVEFVFSAIGRLSCHPDILKASVPPLLTHIVNLNSSVFSEGVLQRGRYTCNCLVTITRGSVADPVSVEYLKSHLVPKILVLTISGALAGQPEALLTHGDIIQALAVCLRMVVQNLHQSGELVSTIVRTYMDGDLSSFNDVVNNNSIGFQPLKVTSSWRQTQLLTLLVAVLCSLPKHISVPQQDLLMARLEEVACGASHQPSATAAAKGLAGLLNKLPTDAAVASLRENICHNLVKILGDPTADVSDRVRALTLWSWVTKAVVLRGHPSQTACVERVLELLRDTVLAETAAEAFHIILENFNDIMNIEMHADIRLMYKQRFFLQTMPRLVDGFKKSSQDQQVPYLTALSHILRHLPKEVLAMELPPLLPLLIQSLACQKVAVQLATMRTLSDLLTDQPKLLVPYVDEIITNVLRLCGYKPDMIVRRTALQVMALMIALPHPTIVPHQNKVVRSLTSCLDDHKRLVRQEAVLARTEWYLVGTADT